MKRILLVAVLVLLATAFSGYARAEEQTVVKSMAFTIKLAGDEAAASDMANAMLFIHALKAVGGEIHFEGDNVVIKLDLTPEKVEALRLALEQGGLPVGLMPGVVLKKGDMPEGMEDFICPPRKSGSHERFLLGNKDEKGKGYSESYTSRGLPEMPEIKCPHCGKTFRPDMPKMMMPHPPMPPMPPSGGEFKPEMPHGPMPYGGMIPGMGPMHEDAMKQLQSLREQMEQMRAEQGELWRALEELHMQLGQVHKMDRAKCEDLDALWRALDKLYAELDEEDD